MRCFTILFSMLLFNSLLLSGKNGTPVTDSLTHELNSIFNEGHFNGFGVAIVNEHGVLYQKAFGLSDVLLQKEYTTGTLQNIASVSKTLVGVALMKAVEMGKLNIDDPINKYLPFKVMNPFFPNSAITIRQLTNHTSTIIDNEFYLKKNYFILPGEHTTNSALTFNNEQEFMPYDSAVSLETFLRNTLTPKGRWYKKEGFLNEEPGAIYEYSNTATSLAAYIVEQATGEPFDTFTRKYILDPLKMNASGWHYNDVKGSNFSKLYSNPATVLPLYGLISYPDGNFITSTNELAKFLVELINGYNGNGTILTRKNYKILFTPQLTAANFKERNESNPYSESYNVGIFMGFGYSGYIGHTGGDPGVMSMLFFDPKSNIGRIMIFNTTFSDKAGNDAFYGIWNILEKYQTRLQEKNKE